jgi:hypothetical protein
MKAVVVWTAAVAVALGGCTEGAPANGTEGAHSVAQAPLVGAWRLAWLEVPGTDGTLTRMTDAKGSLIYTPEGLVAVQVMFARAANPSPNAPVQYAQDGYEASFGRYVVDTATRTVTHHYDGSLVRALLAQDLPRRYELSEGRLTIRSTRSDEHWSVVWERY